MTLTISVEKLEEIIAGADGEAVFNLRNIQGTTSAVLPTKALEKFADAGLGAAFKLPQGTVSLDSEALASMARQAAGASVTISLKKADSAGLTEEQRTAAGDNMVYDLSVVSGGKNISSFDGGEPSINLPYAV